MSRCCPPSDANAESLCPPTTLPVKLANCAVTMKIKKSESSLSSAIQNCSLYIKVRLSTPNESLSNKQLISWKTARVMLRDTLKELHLKCSRQTSGFKVYTFPQWWHWAETSSCLRCIIEDTSYGVSEHRLGDQQSNTDAQRMHVWRWYSLRLCRGNLQLSL